MARFGERRATLYKKAQQLESDFGVKLDIRIISSKKELYCYQSEGWDSSSLPIPTETKGPGDIMTHNEAKARESHSAPRYGGSVLSSDAGHQRKGSAAQVSSRSGRSSSSPDSIPEIASKEDHETPLNASNHPMQTPNTPQSIYTRDITVPYSHFRTSSTQEGQHRRRGSEAIARPDHHFENSPSPPKRTYNSLCDLRTGIASSSSGALGMGGSSSVREESPSKRRHIKQESVRRLLGSIPQCVPAPPSLQSPLKSTW